MKKRIGLLASLLIAMLLISACSLMEPFDASGYVRAVLDASTKGEFDAYIEFTDSSKEQAQKMYNNILNREVKALELDDVSDELLTKFRELFVEIYQLTRYEVLEAEQGEEKTFTVDVRIEPLMIFENLHEEITTAIEEYIQEIFRNATAGEGVPTDEEVREGAAQRVYEVLAVRLANPVYGERQTLTVVVARDDDNVYGISEADYKKLLNMIFGLE